jgi:hypothetical protein
MDTESTATEAICRGYAERMQTLLGRPVALYTGDWWWTAKGRNWNGAAITPYLWSAPNAGYLGSYPGDASPHWHAGYGGWADLSVMQYAVAPLSLPGGKRGTIDVSKSAIRTETVWRDLTIGRPGMSYAPDTLLAARRLYIDMLARAGYRIDPLAVGIVGDDSHANSGTSYHLGKDALRAGSYSTSESSRDRNPTNAAMALDLGWFDITVDGKRHTLYTFNRWLVDQLEAGTPDTADIREIIYSLDGKTVKRWDRLGKRTTGESSHTSHTHESWFRDSENRDKTAHLRRYFTEIGVLEDDDMDAAQTTAWLKSPEGKGAFTAALYESLALMADAAGGRDGTAQPATPTGRQMKNNLGRVLALNAAPQQAALDAILRNVIADDGDRAAVEAKIAALHAEIGSVPQATADLLGGSGASVADKAEILRAVLGDDAAEVGRLLSGQA